MGKRYYCDYCDKTMNASPSIVKQHNQGLVHQKLVREHYLQYKEPEEILLEEKQKKPCSRFFRGTCHFGSICHYSHYTQEQINELDKLVAAKKSNKTNYKQPLFQDLYHQLQSQKSIKSKDGDKSVLCAANGVTYTFPWTYNEIYDNYNLPPSLKRIELNDFVNVEFSEWG